MNKIIFLILLSYSQLVIGALILVGSGNEVGTFQVSAGIQLPLFNELPPFRVNLTLTFPPTSLQHTGSEAVVILIETLTPSDASRLNTYDMACRLGNTTFFSENNLNMDDDVVVNVPVCEDSYPCEALCSASSLSCAGVTSPLATYPCYTYNSGCTFSVICFNTPYDYALSSVGCGGCGFGTPCYYEGVCVSPPSQGTRDLTLVINEVTSAPTPLPTAPTSAPTGSPTAAPTGTGAPTAAPTAAPTNACLDSWSYDSFDAPGQGWTSEWVDFGDAVSGLDDGDVAIVDGALRLGKSGASVSRTAAVSAETRHLGVLFDFETGIDTLAPFIVTFTATGTGDSATVELQLSGLVGAQSGHRFVDLDSLVSPGVNQVTLKFAATTFAVRSATNYFAVTRILLFHACRRNSVSSCQNFTASGDNNFSPAEWQLSADALLSNNQLLLRGSSGGVQRAYAGRAIAFDSGAIDQQRVDLSFSWSVTGSSASSPANSVAVVAESRNAAADLLISESTVMLLSGFDQRQSGIGFARLAAEGALRPAAAGATQLAIRFADQSLVDGNTLVVIENVQLQVYCGDPSPPPTSSPTGSPTNSPTGAPTLVPTLNPTTVPTSAPTAAPTVVPTSTPTIHPTLGPTAAPTAAPTTAVTASATPVLSSLPDTSALIFFTVPSTSNSNVLGISFNITTSAAFNAPVDEMIVNLSELLNVNRTSIVVFADDKTSSSFRVEISNSDTDNDISETLNRLRAALSGDEESAALFDRNLLAMFETISKPAPFSVASGGGVRGQLDQPPVPGLPLEAVIGAVLAVFVLLLVVFAFIGWQRKRAHNKGGRSKTTTARSVEVPLGDLAVVKKSSSRSGDSMVEQGKMVRRKSSRRRRPMTPRSPRTGSQEYSLAPPPGSALDDEYAPPPSQLSLTQHSKTGSAIDDEYAPPPSQLSSAQHPKTGSVIDDEYAPPPTQLLSGQAAKPLEYDDAPLTKKTPAPKHLTSMDAEYDDVPLTRIHTTNEDTNDAVPPDTEYCEPPTQLLSSLGNQRNDDEYVEPPLNLMQKPEVVQPDTEYIEPPSNLILKK